MSSMTILQASRLRVVQWRTTTKQHVRKKENANVSNVALKSQLAEDENTRVKNDLQNNAKDIFEDKKIFVLILK